MSGATTLPRPKATPPPDPAPDPSDRATVINLKGSLAYIAWMDRINKKTHLPKATIFRVAVAEWAERHGHEPPPEL